MKNKTALKKAELIAKLAADKKGENIVLMNMKNITTMCDWFVIVSANSSRMVNGISNFVRRELSRKKISPSNFEGLQNPYWVLLDYDDVVLHVFCSDIRDFYALESLWSDAPKKRYER